MLKFFILSSVLIILAGCSMKPTNIKIPVNDKENYLNNDDYTVILKRTLNEIDKQVAKSTVCDFKVDYRSIVAYGYHYQYTQNATSKVLFTNYFNQKFPLKCMGVVDEFNSKIETIFNKNLNIYKKEKRIQQEREKIIQQQREREEKIIQQQREREEKIIQQKAKQQREKEAVAVQRQREKIRMKQEQDCNELNLKIDNASGQALIKLYSKLDSLNCE